MSGNWSLRRFFSESQQAQVRDRDTDTPELIEVGDFTIDTHNRLVSLRGEKLPLTPEEFDVLVFLTTHPQRCVTPHTVLATSWTSNGLHQTEFLRALLSLRRKLDAVSDGKQYLRTEPWVVYRFDPRSSFAT